MEAIVWEGGCFRLISHREVALRVRLMSPSNPIGRALAVALVL
jgi:hypothetical protein